MSTARRGNAIMLDRRLILSGIWILIVLIYLLGDVLRIYSGDAARMADAQQPNDVKWLFAAIFVLIPILMVFLSLVLPQSINRPLNIILAVVFFLFVLVDQGSFPSTYDKFLLVVSMVFNVVTVWFAWKWSDGNATS